jgi:ribosome-binding protein aMBF1 (putative translation factor)
VPTTPKTTGDLIRLARYEKGLNLSEIALKLEVRTSAVKAWEEDIQTPTQIEWNAVAKLLCIPNVAMQPNNLTQE